MGAVMKWYERMQQTMFFVFLRMNHIRLCWYIMRDIEQSLEYVFEKRMNWQNQLVFPLHVWSLGFYI